MMRQLAFPLPSQPRYDAEEFLVAPNNQSAHALTTAWPAWPDPVLILTGAAGSGKTHLGSIWAQQSEALILPPTAVKADAHFSRFYGRMLFIDDADQVRDEQALFHLFNMAQEAKTSMLLTASRESEFWDVRLPDLASRLRRAPRVNIQAPDEELVRAVLVKLFLDRQIAIGAEVIDYLAQRLGRSLDDARTIVAMLDREALERGRRITRPMAIEILRRFEGLTEQYPE